MIFKLKQQDPNMTQINKEADWEWERIWRHSTLALVVGLVEEYCMSKILTMNYFESMDLNRINRRNSINSIK